MGLASKLAAAQSGAGGPPGGAGGYGAGMPPQTSYGQQQPAQQSYGQQPPAQAPYGAAPSGYGAGAPPQQPYGAQSSSHPSSMQPGGYSQGPLAGQQGQGQGGYGAPPGPPPTGARPTSGQYGQGAPPAAGAPPPYGAPPPEKASYGAPTQQGYGQQPPAAQQAYGQPAGGAYGGAQQSPRPGGGGVSAMQIQQVLEGCVREQKLNAFYPPGSPAIQQIAQRVASSGALEKVSQQWRLPMEIAIDLCKLALFDTVLFLDDSGSMQFEENGERIDDLKLIIGRVAFAASLFDTDGIQVRFMNSQVQGNGLRTEAEAVQLVSQVKFSGLTPFGSQIDQKVIFPLLLQPARSGQLQKPVLIIAVTDGQPAGEDRHMIFNVLLRATDELARTRYGADALSFSIAQVGNDIKARAFLEELDSDPRIGSMIDCTSNYELEADEMSKKGVELTPELWLVKLLLGSIDDSYDEKDEVRR